MSEDFVEGAFLGLAARDGPVDVAIVPLAYELTTSYGTGACDGPQACIEASGQVELYDDRLGTNLPAGVNVATEPVWEGTAPTLRGQLDELANHASGFYTGHLFPLFLGGEHGILPPLLHAARHHRAVNGDLRSLTVVQLVAHGDLREELDGEVFSHACAASRSLDVGVGRVLQAGVRAYSMDEALRIRDDDRLTTFFARATQHPHTGASVWNRWLETISELSGPVPFTLDIDGLDGALVPATGTPVPGGLNYWQAVETIEALFANPDVVVVSADINEIVAQQDTPLTQFTAACLASKIVANHVLARKEGRWVAHETSASATPSTYFENFQPTPFSTNKKHRTGDRGVSS